jgi:hypothetical protein
VERDSPAGGRRNPPLPRRRQPGIGDGSPELEAQDPAAKGQIRAEVQAHEAKFRRQVSMLLNLLFFVVDNAAKSQNACPPHFFSGESYILLRDTKRCSTQVVVASLANIKQALQNLR